MQHSSAAPRTQRELNMQLKSPPRNATTEREEREAQLRDFITSNLASLIEGPDAMLLIARAPDSLPARILFEMSSVLASHNLGAQIAFTGAAVATDGDAWRMQFDPSFTHEIRVLRDPRYLDGHEQLVLGGRSLWFGDSMRREPDKRDAFVSFVDGNEEVTARSRATFKRVWMAAKPIYAHGPVAVVVAPAAEPESMPAAQVAAGVPPGTVETLEAWQVSTRH